MCTEQLTVFYIYHTCDVSEGYYDSIIYESCYSDIMS